MPYNRRGSYGRNRGMRPVINSIKNVFLGVSSTGTTAVALNPAKAVNSPVSTVASDTSNGCIIKAFWLSLDFCGLAATGVLQTTDVYLMKNPGANLTAPSPLAQGTSNEKRFIIKSWRQMTMRNQDGNPPYHWEGWIKIPKRYQRMGTDDLWQLVFVTSTAAGHLSCQFIYKWYR